MVSAPIAPAGSARATTWRRVVLTTDAGFLSRWRMSWTAAAPPPANTHVIANPAITYIEAYWPYCSGPSPRVVTGNTTISENA